VQNIQLLLSLPLLLTIRDQNPEQIIIINQPLKKSRIDTVDALRGFAVVAIMLLHFVEHFIYNVYPVSTSQTVTLINKAVWDASFFIFGGKSYTIFALLFGFTFIIQQRNQELKVLKHFHLNQHLI